MAKQGSWSVIPPGPLERGESVDANPVLSFNVTESDLREAFQAFGTVEKAAIITDKGTSP